MDLAVRHMARLLEASERATAFDGHVSYCPYQPNSDVQRRFVESDEFALLMGGGTGGGKTFGLVMSALRHVHVPGYQALIIRRHYKDLTKPDGALWVANEWLSRTPAKYSASNNHWIFPHEDGPPSVLQFGHCDSDKSIWSLMGPSYSFVGFDELGEFPTPYAWDVVKTRFRRRAGSELPERLRATGNPGGPGQGWIKRELVDKGHLLHSTYRDNPDIDRERYGEILATLDETKRAWFREGDWAAKPAGRIYPFGPENLIDGIELLEPEDWHVVAVLDLGSDQTRPTTALVVLAWHVELPHRVVVLHASKRAKGSPDVYEDMLRYARSRWPGCACWADPGALGNGIIADLNRRMQIGVCGVDKPRGYKRGARLIVAGEIEAGRVLVCAPECGPLLEEADELTWDDDGMDARPGTADHATDALLYGMMQTHAYLSRSPDPPKTREAQLNDEMAQRKAELARPKTAGNGWVR